ncbi:hypothetical protein [Blastopirellula marina]|uniref:Uncharacterized protein n=1 Tax=Blastopirellula marina DSM 3645 TaxID=314230 RepID=A3ZMT5_9BACT|nr:hypothetical protein [Blastopirellula marina]EAQ82261.1 hypothetical protein DSM3645_01065 [Blastopirellula marina DSM 3645]
MSISISRRRALQLIGTAASLSCAGRSIAAPAKEKLPPVRAITKGPLHHWFGYYDKQEFDPTNRYVLSNEVAFEHRTPTADDVIRVGMIDTQQNDKWTRLGDSRAWGWQQGCMLQWRPNSASEVVWNDREGDQHVCRILDIHTRELRTLPRPIYALSGDGKWAITADFSRIQRMRPGYGYVGLQDPCAQQRAPEDSGIWKMNMDTGESQLIFSLADAASIDYQGKSLRDKWNYFNHLLVSPDSSRLIVLHRWRDSTGDGPDAEPTGRFTTRMFTVGMDGSERYILDPSGNTSHFVWRDNNHICAWTQPEDKPAAFYLFRDQTPELQVVGEGVMTVNGHNTYLPNTDNEWILNDTYPSKKTREQNPYLYHVPSGRRVWLGHFHSPPQYTGEWRCDTHPRSSNDGRSVVIDSPHTGSRQLHLIDVSEIVG